MKIGLANYDDLLGRLLNIPQQQGGIAGDLSPEISPVFVMENDRPEWCYLKGERCLAGSILIPATAAVNSLATLRNPLNSGVIAVVEAINAYSTGVATTIAAYVGGQRQIDLVGGSGTLQSRDARLRQHGACTFTYDVAGAAVAGTLVERIQSTLGMPFQTLPFILIPGSSIDIVNSSLNQDLYVSVAVRERELRKYEL